MPRTELDRARLEHMMSCSFVGAPDTVRQGLEGFLRRTGADELLVTAQIYDHAARLRSFEIVAGLRDSLGAAPETSPGASREAAHPVRTV